eukprot:12352629-Ditylum_brightwellii.AAC.1
MERTMLSISSIRSRPIRTRKTSLISRNRFYLSIIYQICQLKMLMLSLPTSDRRLMPDLRLPDKPNYRSDTNSV